MFVICCSHFVATLCYKMVANLVCGSRADHAHSVRVIHTYYTLLRNTNEYHQILPSRKNYYRV
jgi:hypothetical protein